MKKITFDIETSNLFQDVGKANPVLLDLSVVCIHDSETDEYSAYTQEELPNLWPVLEKADMLIGYNSDHFDIPLLNKYYPGDLTHIKSLDILKEIKKKLGRRLKLDSVAEATLGRKKIGTGLEATTWWKNGEVEKVKEYCKEDVKITKELYDYVLKNGVLKYKDLGKTRDIKLDTSEWEKEKDGSITHTLPF
ncbi:MAG: ribonuclease H-like domain-containing protein [Candidatus Pacebacteria bacterium]|nr:ribonuclease H-like domain-containing protein [Candidatus Paceibacterota bacterium]